MPVPSFLELNLIRKKLILDLKYKTCETQCFIRIFSWEKSTFFEFINSTDEFLETFNHKKGKIDFLRYEHFLEEFGPFSGPTSTECVLFGQLTVIFVSICVLPVGLITFFFGECIERVVPKLLKFFAFLCCL